MIFNSDTEKLFCNIPEIYAANRTFWHHHVFPMLQVNYDGDDDDVEDDRENSEETFSFHIEIDLIIRDHRYDCGVMVMMV